MFVVLQRPFKESGFMSKVRFVLKQPLGDQLKFSLRPRFAIRKYENLYNLLFGIKSSKVLQYFVRNKCEFGITDFATFCS